jgi:hypothetical protein
MRRYAHNSGGQVHCVIGKLINDIDLKIVSLVSVRAASEGSYQNHFESNHLICLDEWARENTVGEDGTTPEVTVGDLDIGTKRDSLLAKVPIGRYPSIDDGKVSDGAKGSTNPR